MSIDQAIAEYFSAKQEVTTWRDALRDRIVHAHNGGETLAGIARNVGVSLPCLRRRIVGTYQSTDSGDYRTAYREMNNAIKRRNTATATLIAAVRAYHATYNCTYAETARVVGVVPRTIRQWIIGGTGE